MIKLELSPDTRWDYVSTYLGFVSHGRDNSVGAGIHQDFKSTLKTRRYMCGLEPPNYPMPAIPNHLDLIAGEPETPQQDFSAIGHYGSVRYMEWYRGH